MKPGDIVFVRGNTLISSIIRIVDPGRFSHVAIAVSESEILEIDVLTRGRIIPLSYSDIEIVEMDLTPDQQTRIPAAAKAYVGWNYDIPQALWYAVRRVFHITGRNRWDSPKAAICMELVARLLADVGGLPPYDENGSMTPNEFYIFLKQRKATHSGSVLDI